MVAPFRLCVAVALAALVVDATVDTDNCDCYKEAIQDAEAAALQSAESHSDDEASEDGSGDSHEDDHVALSDGTECTPSVQYAAIRAANGDIAAIVDAAELECAAALSEQTTKMSLDAAIPTFTASSAKECSKLCVRCGCGGFNYQNKTDGCFPGDATVELQSGAAIAMADLKVGDVVRVGAGAADFSKVYMFTHRDADVKAKFVKIATASGSEVRMTSGHYLYVNGQLQTARTVKVGDVVSAGNVTAVSSEWAEGFYNPHTMAGDIVVNGVKTSTYTDAVAPSLAHALLWPARMLYGAGVQVAGDDWNQGGQSWTTFASKFGLAGADKEYN
jgi:hypothetical protein